MKSRQRLFVSFGLNSSLVLVEMLVGLAIGSAAVIADGLKNLTDSVMLAVAFWSEAEHRPKKAKISADIFNILAVYFIAVTVTFETWNRLGQPGRISSFAVMTVGALALAVNLAAAILIRAQKRIASRASFWGLFSSALSGAIVFISGALDSIFRTQRFDFWAGILVAGLLLMVAIKLTKDFFAEIG